MDRIVLILSQIMLQVGAVMIGLLCMLYFFGPTLTGGALGIVLGFFVMAGLVGWGLNAWGHVPYPFADIIPLILLAFASGFTNSSPDRSMTVTWLLYGAGAVGAFFLLDAYHRAKRPARNRGANV